MTAKELDTMVNAMRTKRNKIIRRMDVTDSIYYLYIGLREIGRNELATELLELYMEIDGIDTDEVIKMGTFR